MTIIDTPQAPFVPHIVRRPNGKVSFKVDERQSGDGMSVKDVLGVRLCYVEKGVVLAIAIFDEGGGGMADDGSNLTFDAYYPEGQVRPELFEGLTALQIADMLFRGQLEWLIALDDSDQISIVWDMREGYKQGRTYIVSTCAFDDGLLGAHLQLFVPYVYEEVSDSPILSSDELREVMGQPASDSHYVINRSRGLSAKDGKSPSQLYEDGVRVIVENWWQ